MPRKLELTQDQVALVDDDVYELVTGYNWQAQKHPVTGLYYARRNESITRKIRLLHYDVLEIKGVEVPPGHVIDHINNDTLDCQFHNLRVATRSQNNANRRVSRKSRSKYRGVTLTQDGKYTARCGPKMKCRSLGRYDLEIDAAKAYDAEARRVWGQFAKLNFPEENQ